MNLLGWTLAEGREYMQGRTLESETLIADPGGFLLRDGTSGPRGWRQPSGSGTIFGGIDIGRRDGPEEP